MCKSVFTGGGHFHKGLQLLNENMHNRFPALWLLTHILRSNNITNLFLSASIHTTSLQYGPHTDHIYLQHFCKLCIFQKGWAFSKKIFTDLFICTDRQSLNNSDLSFTGVHILPCQLWKYSLSNLRMSGRLYQTAEITFYPEFCPFISGNMMHHHQITNSGDDNTKIN